MLIGIMAGLGFGRTEGVQYQSFENKRVGSPELYYFLNFLRITSLPFAHAIWAGISGYFIGLSKLTPRLSFGLLFAAILIPALFHAAHNSIGLGGLAQILPALISVVALLSYLTNEKLSPTTTTDTSTNNTNSTPPTHS
jgi:RsiW-degrading membrane proteinase PrsW (M82 family)